MDAAAMGRNGVPMVLLSLALSGLWEQSIVSQRRIVASVAKKARRHRRAAQMEFGIFHWAAEQWRHLRDARVAARKKAKPISTASPTVAAIAPLRLLQRE
jgi:hypothetical protein